MLTGTFHGITDVSLSDSITVSDIPGQEKETVCLKDVLYRLTVIVDVLPMSAFVADTLLARGIVSSEIVPLAVQSPEDAEEFDGP